MAARARKRPTLGERLAAERAARRELENLLKMQNGPREITGAEGLKFRQVGVGASVGQWICDGVSVIPQGEETLTAAWMRGFDLLRAIDRSMTNLNTILRDDEDDPGGFKAEVRRIRGDES